jgi:hypothetical protein
MLGGLRIFKDYEMTNGDGDAFSLCVIAKGVRTRCCRSSTLCPLAYIGVFPIVVRRLRPMCLRGYAQSIGVNSRGLVKHFIPLICRGMVAIRADDRQAADREFRLRVSECIDIKGCFNVVEFLVATWTRQNSVRH